MKRDIKRIKAAEPAPIDSVDVIDRVEFEDRLVDVGQYIDLNIGGVREDIEKTKKQIKMLAGIFGGVAVALGIAILFRRED